MLEAIVFYALAALLIGMGLLVITRTNPIASALAMVGAFGALAALYATLSATLLAIIQILVYAGGIMVLVIFVIMLLNLHAEDLKKMEADRVSVGLNLGIALGCVAAPVALILAMGAWAPSSPPPGFGDIFSVGAKLFADYLFPFEMLSLLLLAAVVGALVLSKRKL